MKKIIVTTVLALIGFAATAQTVDYTGVSINTERVKKTYGRARHRCAGIDY